MYKNILAALDKGPCIEVVSKRAIEIALAHQARLTLCHVKKNKVIYSGSVDPMGMMSLPHVIQDHSYSLEETLKEIQKAAIEAGVEEVEVVETYSSAPGIAIADTIAPGYEVDLIVCGKSDKSHLNRFLLGSVSSNIMNYAVCDVLLIRDSKGKGE